MPEKFNPVEILDIAIEVEKNGAALYQMLAAHTVDAAAKKAWQFLADAEIQHRELFTAMREASNEFVVEGSPNAEYDAYMAALAREYIFTSSTMAEAVKKPALSQKEALGFALAIEKESVLVYTGLRRYVAREKQQEIDRIIDEERNHMVVLTQMRWAL